MTTTRSAYDGNDDNSQRLCCELTLPFGGGIVVDSTPEGEWQETHAKARAFVSALRR